jgi:acetoin utilization deacetylase AcuC-like enzyme
MAARAKDFVPRPGRTIVVLEGGYDLSALAASAGAVLAAMLGQSYHPEPVTSGGPGQRAVDEAGEVYRRSKSSFDL